MPSKINVFSEISPLILLLKLMFLENLLRAFQRHKTLQTSSEQGQSFGSE